MFVHLPSVEFMTEGCLHAVSPPFHKLIPGSISANFMDRRRMQSWTSRLHSFAFMSFPLLLRLGHKSEKIYVLQLFGGK